MKRRDTETKPRKAVRWGRSRRDHRSEPRASWWPHRMLDYLRTDIWRLRLEDAPKAKSIFIRGLRVIVLSVRGFDEDRCLLHSSALTFFTLLSIVPILAMAFGIAKGFGFQSALEAKILELSEGQTEAFEKIILFSKNMLENTSGGVIAGIGMAFLFWSTIKLLGNVEQAFNEIWGIQRSRSIIRKFTDYLSFMLVAPALFMVAGSVTVFISAEVANLLEGVSFLEPISGLALKALGILPLMMVWALFTFTYKFMPNGPVKLGSALIGGIIAGTLYHLIQWLYIFFQIGINRYGAVYGSFAALPLFLIWLQISWFSVLYGAELCFAFENVDTYEFEPDCRRASPALKRLLSVAIVHRCADRFRAAGPPPTAAELSHELEAPARLVNQLLYELVDARVLSEVVRDEGAVTAYQPARSAHDLTVQEVVDLLETRGNSTIPHLNTEEIERVAESLEALRQAARTSDANRRLDAL